MNIKVEIELPGEVAFEIANFHLRKSLKGLTMDEYYVLQQVKKFILANYSDQPIKTIANEVPS